MSVRLRDSAGRDWRTEKIVCERNNGETQESYCFAGQALQSADRGDASSGRDGFNREFGLTIPAGLAGQPEPGESWVIKVLVRDTDGRLATTWATYDASTAAPLQITGVDQPERR